MLDYFALALLIFVVLVLFYGIIAIHDIPYEIAKARQHPQQDAIHIAGWVSLLTLHVIWPFLWIWATLYRSDRGWGFISESEDKEIVPKLIAMNEQANQKINKLESDNLSLRSSIQEQMNALKKQIEQIYMDMKKEEK